MSAPATTQAKDRPRLMPGAGHWYLGLRGFAWVYFVAIGGSYLVGMLIGVSALTTIGLRRYYAEAGDLPPPLQVCGGTTSRCAAFEHLLREAGIAQEQTVFAGAAVCAVLAAVLALVLFRSVETRALPSRPWTEPWMEP